ncbi:MAG: hypothetical protein HQL97_14940 [Magnetococcales bacterium]|nr:hypothetical protein [Magnetococcales bacterium]MBF0263123.1 hypothetical protein [Magnetococcales bacterium]
MSGLGESGTDHQLEEEIGVEVQNMLRAEMSGNVPAVERELTEDEQQLFSEAFLSSTLEEMIPTVAQERRLMAVPKVAKSGKRAKVAPKRSKRGGKGSEKKGGKPSGKKGKPKSSPKRGGRGKKR